MRHGLREAEALVYIREGQAPERIEWNMPGARCPASICSNVFSGMAGRSEGHCGSYRRCAVVRTVKTKENSKISADRALVTLIPVGNQPNDIVIKAFTVKAR